jgi:ATP-dependent Clp protease ATP-binding subunit ClpC
MRIGESIAVRKVHVRAFNEADTLGVLLARKSRLEKFHGVDYTEEALEFAAHSSGSISREVHSRERGSNCLMQPDRWSALPAEIVDAQKSIKSVISRLETAIAKHEFEKARYYSDEERKQRENLRALREKFHLDDSSSAVVGLDDLKELVSRWAAYPYCP